VRFSRGRNGLLVRVRRLEFIGCSASCCWVPLRAMFWCTAASRGNILFGLMANRQILAGFWVAEEQVSRRVVGGEVHQAWAIWAIWSIKPPRSARSAPKGRQAAILSPASQCARLEVTLRSLALAHPGSQPPWPLAILPQESLLALTPLPSPPQSHPPQQNRAMPAAPRFPFEIIAAMYGPKQ
jgi:hypothetical protein